MSKASKAAAGAAAAATPPPFRPPPLPVEAIVEQANEDSLLPSFVHASLNSIVHASIERLYHAGIERAAEQYVAQQAVLDVLSVVEWQLLERDEGEQKWIDGWEGMTAADEAERQRHLWTAEDEPLPTTIDRWARHVLPVAAAPEAASDNTRDRWQEAGSEALTTDEYVPSDSAIASQASALLDSTAPFSVVSATTSSIAAYTRSPASIPSKPQRLPSPSAAHRPRQPSTMSVSSSQAASAPVPYPLPSASPPAASEQQRLARMAILKQQQAEIAERKKKERERAAEEERRKEDEKAKERALMSARRQKAATLQSTRAPAADSSTQPRKRPTQPAPSQHEDKQPLPDASPASSSVASLPALPAARRFTQAAKPKRGLKQPVDDATVDGYTNAAALMASIVRAFVPATGVRLLCGSEVKAGPEVGGGGGGEGRGREVSVEDEQWVGVVRGMNRSQYMRWMDEQRAQAAKEADIQLRQHHILASPSQAQPAQQLSPRRVAAHGGDEADQQSTTVQPAIRVRPPERAEHEEKMQLTARAPVVLQPRVVSRERRAKDLSFDSRIIADSAWGSNNSVAQRGGEARGPAYELLDKPKSSTTVRERKVVVSVQRRTQRLKGEVMAQESERQHRPASGSRAGQVKIAGDKSRVAALLQPGKGREGGSSVTDGD